MAHPTVGRSVGRSVKLLKVHRRGSIRQLEFFIHWMQPTVRVFHLCGCIRRSDFFIQMDASDPIVRFFIHVRAIPACWCTSFLLSRSSFVAFVLVLLLHAVCSFVAFSIAAQFARFPAAAISVSMAAVQQAPAEVTEVDQLSRIRLELATLDQIRCVFRRPHFRLLCLFVCFAFVCISLFYFFISIPVLFCGKWNFSNVSVWSGFFLILKKKDSIIAGGVCSDNVGLCIGLVNKGILAFATLFRLRSVVVLLFKKCVLFCFIPRRFSNPLLFVNSCRQVAGESVSAFLFQLAAKQCCLSLGFQPRSADLWFFLFFPFWSFVLEINLVVMHSFKDFTE